MLWAATFLLAATDLLGAAELRALGDSDDARAIVHLESALDSRLAELDSFPEHLAPPDLEDEIVAAMLSLERLEREVALSWARTILETPSSGSVTLTARRVLARSGDRSVVTVALQSYFRQPRVWHEVLSDAAAATHDIRLRDFGELARESSPPSAALLESRLRRALGESTAFPSPSSFGHLLDDDFLEVQREVLALAAPARYRATQFLAARDHEGLIGLPMTSETIDRLYPYLARSRHRQLRDRLHRSESARGAALASLLLSPEADLEEQRHHAEVMRDAWFDAMVAAGQDVVTPIVGEASMAREIGAAAPAAGMVHVRLPQARARLEQAATPSSIRWLGRRPDKLLSMPTLSALREAAIQDVRTAAEIELLRMGAPGSDAYLRSQLESDSLDEILPAASESTLDAELLSRAIERVAGRTGPQPVAFAAMSQFHERYPREFLAWLGADDSRLEERAHFVMALSGEPRRLPLLIELAVTGRGSSRDAALRGLSEAELGNFDQRLHRLAGDPERSVRFQTALALVPSGHEWALRLLGAELDEAKPSEVMRARRVLERLSSDRARELIQILVSNGTASPLLVELYLDLLSVGAPDEWRDRLWQTLAPYVEKGAPIALLSAARLSHPDATAAVERYLDR